MRAPRAAAGFKSKFERAPIQLWPDLVLITVFWNYVALANVLWGISMEASLARMGIAHDVWRPEYLVTYNAGGCDEYIS